MQSPTTAFGGQISRDCCIQKFRIALLFMKEYGDPPHKANSLEQVFVTKSPPAQDHRQSEPEHEAIKVACVPTVTH